MKKQRAAIGIAICTSDTAVQKKALAYALELTGNGVDTAVFSSYGNILGKEFISGENSVFDMIVYEFFDGFIICSEDGAACSAVKEKAKDILCAETDASWSDTSAADELVKKLTGFVPDMTAALNNIRSGAKAQPENNIMLEKLVESENISEYFQRMSKYMSLYESTEGFYLCLMPETMYSAPADGKHTDKLLLPYIYENKTALTDFSREYDRSEMLPAFSAERDKAACFVFSPLHFLGKKYGFTAVRMSKEGSLDLAGAALWRKYASVALEVRRDKLAGRSGDSDTQIRDPLTGLHNIRGYMQIMTSRCGNFDDKGKLLRILSIDVENLKGINDSFGYDEGDRLLNKIARIMTECAGENDICVRVGADEFFIAGMIEDEEGSDSISEDLERALETYNSAEGNLYGISIFTSYVTSPLDNSKILETLPYDASYQRAINKDSHSKMLGAKAPDKSRFDPEERKNVLRLIEENLFTYNFQPIVDAKTGEIKAYEALMRSGEYRISPLSILSHAEAMGKLYDIEKCTISNTLEFISKNPALFSQRRLFINCIPSCVLSSSDFEELYEKYKDAFKKSVIEFTEQTEADEDQLQTLLDRSAKAGYRIAIDDYGTGYSNISNLLNFMPNYVKIDRSLIMNIHKDKRKQHFTKNIIDYAHDNNFKALAEGVELREELQMLISMGADLIQGYYTAKPAETPVSEIKKEISDEIRSINRKIEFKKTRKTYFTGSESEISLMALDFDGYTDVVVTKENYTFIGNANYQSELVIKLRDNLDCHLKLVDVSMKNEHMDSCIAVGNGGDLTLEICGNAEIAGSIYVPESASIDIIGDGELTIQSSWNHPYAIGSDMNRSYGNIGIHLNNKLTVHLDSEKSVAIGGGYNNSGSVISVGTKKMEIVQTGKFSMAIGCVHSSLKAVIKDTALYCEGRSADSIGIGSTDSTADVSSEGSELRFDLSGNFAGGIVSNGGERGNIRLSDSSVNLTVRAKEAYGIGSKDSAADIELSGCSIDILCEGTSAVAVGNAGGTSSISIDGCSGRIEVNSGHGTAYGAKKENLTVTESAVELFTNE